MKRECRPRQKRLVKAHSTSCSTSVPMMDYPQATWRTHGVTCVSSVLPLVPVSAEGRVSRRAIPTPQVSPGVSAWVLAPRLIHVQALLAATWRACQLSHRKKLPQLTMIHVRAVRAPHPDASRSRREDAAGPGGRARPREVPNTQAVCAHRIACPPQRAPCATYATCRLRAPPVSPGCIEMRKHACAHCSTRRGSPVWHPR